jgi:hypothetical protein
MTHTVIFLLQYGVVISNKIILGMRVSSKETIYTNVKSCGATGYIADSDRNAEGLLTLLTLLTSDDTADTADTC